MRRKIALTILVPALVALAWAGPVQAGCCAIVTLDALPAQVVAGQPVRISFMYRINHAPAAGYQPEISASHARTSASFTVIAEPQERAGHYAATLTFPVAGEWHWSITSQPMPPLTVFTAAPPERADTSLPLAAGIAGLGSSAIALIVLLRSRARRAIAPLVAGALIGVTGLTWASQASAATHSFANPAAPAEYGRVLLMAKGCIVCHRHEAIAEAYWSAEVGPNLAHLKIDPDYLRRWLKDPSAIRPGTYMPTLGLSDGEIEALVAFLTAR
jgi:cytochrome c2